MNTVNTLKNYIKKRSNIYLFLSIILIIGFILGIILGSFNSQNMQSSLISFSNNLKGPNISIFFINFGIITFLIILSLFIISIPIFVIYTFYKGLEIGFIVSLFMFTFNFKGLIFIIIYAILFNLSEIILLFLLFPKCLEMTRLTIGKLIYHHENELKILKLLKNSLTLIVLINIYNLFMCLCGSPILNIFHFLLN